MTPPSLDNGATATIGAHPTLDRECLCLPQRWRRAYVGLSILRLTSNAAIDTLRRRRSIVVAMRYAKDFPLIDVTVDSGGSGRSGGRRHRPGRSRGRLACLLCREAAAPLPLCCAD